MKPTKETYLYTKIIFFAHKDTYLFLQVLLHSLITIFFFFERGYLISIRWREKIKWQAQPGSHVWMGRLAVRGVMSFHRGFLASSKQKTWCLHQVWKKESFNIEDLSELLIVWTSVRGGFGLRTAIIPLSLKSFGNFRWHLDNTWMILMWYLGDS
jgi:hypothetical protein